MAIAGVCWGAYSLAGRRSRDPLGRTAGNFLLASVVGIAFAAIHWPYLNITRSGLLYAVASGALASGVGYTLWYAALPSLAAWRAGVLQLIVPVATAVAATMMLGEAITQRLMAATALVVAGVVLTMLRRASAG
jgi:drug/metabolite transporter (DMT)-like permease